MKNKFSAKVKFLSFLLVLSMVLPTINVFASAGDSSAVINGTYQFSSNEGSNRQSQNTFEYRDDCFTRSSFIGCKHLEVLSIQAASASVSWYGEETDENETEPSENGGVAFDDLPEDFMCPRCRQGKEKFNKA